MSLYQPLLLLRFRRNPRPPPLLDNLATGARLHVESIVYWPPRQEQEANDLENNPPLANRNTPDVTTCTYCHAGFCPHHVKAHGKAFWFPGHAWSHFLDAYRRKRERLGK